MKNTVDNPIYRRMLRPESLADRLEYLDYMVEYYFKVAMALKQVRFKSPFRAEMATSLQMMYTKGKAMLSLAQGMEQMVNGLVVKTSADHTLLYTIVRTAYEQLCAFELICVIPDTEEKKHIMENIYIASGEVNRLKFFTEEQKARNYAQVADVEKEIERCRREIEQTQLYQSLTKVEKAALEKTIFKKGEYQVVLTSDGKCVSHVGWNDVRKYCGLGTDALYGMYKYACNMAHPSHLALGQFYEAYKEGAIDELNDTAVMQMISMMSVFAIDFIEVFPEVKYVYDKLDEESQFMVRMYSESFRKGT